jgi:hypothetical protein
MSLIKSPQHEAELVAQLNKLTLLETGNGTQSYHGWSYALASGAYKFIPVEINLHVENDQNRDQHQNENQNQVQNRTTVPGVLADAELQGVPEPVELPALERSFSEPSGVLSAQRRPSELSGDLYNVSPIQADRQGQQNFSVYGENAFLRRY